MEIKKPKKTFTRNDMLNSFEAGMKRGLYEMKLAYDSLGVETFKTIKPPTFSKFMDDNFNTK